MSIIKQCLISVLLFLRVVNGFSFFFNSNKKEDTLSTGLDSKFKRDSNSSGDANTTVSTFYNLNVGIDENGLWYVNTSITGQLQQLRLDIAQPYVWVVDSEVNPNFQGDTYSLDYSEVVPFYNDHVYNMSFIDTIQFNASAFISNLSIANTSSGQVMDFEHNTNQQDIDPFGFFVAYNSYSLMGSFGIGGKINNTNWQKSAIQTINFNESFLFLDTLKRKGTISSAGYSLWLAGNVGTEVDLTIYSDNFTEFIFSNFSVGSLMLNYVNSSLFTGDLVKFNSIPYYEVFSEGQSYWSNGYPIFPLSGANLIANNSQSVNLSTSDTLTPILLDSRYTNCFLPIDIIQQIAIQTNAFYVESVESWYVNCELGDINAQVEFFFGQLAITVPLHEFIAAAFLTGENGQETPLYFKSANGLKTSACFLKLKPNYLSGINVLGVSFLKYAYLAADLETNEFALAQAANIEGDSLFTITPIDKEVNINLKTADNSVEKVISLSTISASATELLRASLSTASTSSTSVSSSSATAKFISSGYIPFAKSSNITETSLVLTTFSAASTQSKEYGSNILELFGYNFTYGSIFSNGEIVTATKSFYETNLPSYQWTTVSGSSFLASITSSTVTDSEVNSEYIVTVEYQTQVTQVDGNVTLYGTSTVTIFSNLASNSTPSGQKNKANSPQRYNGHSDHLLKLFNSLGLAGLLWAFF